MLKRPKFLKLLIIIYFIYTIIHILDYAFIVQSSMNNDLTVANIDKLILSYVMSSVTLMYVAITGYLFYGLLSLNPGGWILQIMFSLLYAFAAISSFGDKQGMLETVFLGNNPQAVNIIWGLVNLYVIYYFCKPEIRNLFFNPSLQNQLRKQELTNLFNFSNKFITDIKEGNLKDYKGKKRNILSTLPTKKVSYTKYARILIKENKTIKDSAQVDELNIQIKYKAKRILELLESMLPALKENDILDDISYEYNKKYCWNVNDIINEFKDRASLECKDFSGVTDKIFKFAKIVDEFELLSTTNKLMSRWIEDCGSDVGNLLKI